MSIVSFCISTQMLSSPLHIRGGTFLQILEMMQKWPKLRSIRAEEFLNDEVENDPAWLDTFQASSRCCPDLTDVIFPGAALHASELRFIRATCSRDVEKLDVSLYGNRVRGLNGDAAADALCECLRAWSPTLQCLKITVREKPKLYPPISEAIASLCELRELQLFGIKLDFGFISNLPRLERLALGCRWYVSLRMREMKSLSRHLDIPGMFAPLRHIALFFGGREPPDELQSICRRRNIQLYNRKPEMAAGFLL